MWFVRDVVLSLCMYFVSSFLVLSGCPFVRVRYFFRRSLVLYVVCCVCSLVLYVVMYGLLPVVLYFGSSLFSSFVRTVFLYVVRSLFMYVCRVVLLFSLFISLFSSSFL